MAEELCRDPVGVHETHGFGVDEATYGHFQAEAAGRGAETVRVAKRDLPRPMKPVALTWKRLTGIFKQEDVQKQLAWLKGNAEIQAPSRKKLLMYLRRRRSPTCCANSLHKACLGWC